MQAPKFHIERIFTRLEALATLIRRPPCGLVDEVLTSSNFGEYADAIMQNFARHKPHYRDSLIGLVSPFYGTLITEEKAHDLAWRISAGFESIGQGLVVHPVFCPSGPRWVPLHIDSAVRTTPGRNGRPRMAVTFRVLGGNFPGLTFSHNLGYRYLVKVLATEIGFERFVPVQSHELVQCLLLAELEVTPDCKPQLLNVKANQAIKRRNKFLIARRAAPCARGHSWGCHHCSIGYLYLNAEKAGCNLAAHPYNYESRHCPQCNNPEAFFDPGNERKVCVACAKSNMTRSKEMTR
jgi:hypothetical protein